MKVAVFLAVMLCNRIDIHECFRGTVFLDVPFSCIDIHERFRGTVVLDVMLCSCIDVHEHLEGTCCLHLQGKRVNSILTLCKPISSAQVLVLKLPDKNLGSLLCVITQ
jgi:hypothetical protein